MNNTLANGLTLLELLASTAESFALTEIAQRLAVPKSHAHRLLQTLVASGYAVQDPDRRYRIGLQPLLVSSALLANHPLRREARPWLHRVAEETGLDAILSIPHDQGCGLVLASVHPAGRQVDPATAIGNRMRPGATATAALYEATIPGFAPEPTLSQRRSRAIARDGCAYKDPAMRGGVNGLAVAVRDPDGRVVAALGCSGPTERFVQVHAQARALCHQAAIAIGGTLPSPAATREGTHA